MAAVSVISSRQSAGSRGHVRACKCFFTDTTINPCSQIIYNTFFKRNSVYVTTVFASAFAFSIGFDLATSAWWDAHNRGVSV
jgi:hypothetical protein